MRQTEKYQMIDSVIYFLNSLLVLPILSTTRNVSAELFLKKLAAHSSSSQQDYGFFYFKK